MATLWIFFTLFAAMMQTIRTSLQKSLSLKLDSESVTWARYGFTFPFVLGYFLLVLKTTSSSLQAIPPAFIFWCLAGAIAQILATIMLVNLFQRRNFATCTAWVNTESLQLALLGIFIFSEPISWGGGLAICIGVLGIFVMEFFKDSKKKLELIVVISGLTTALGLGFTAFTIKKAAALLHGHFLVAAAGTLCAMIPMQVILLTVWLFFKKTNEAPFLKIWKQKKQVFLISFTSVLGSIGWFTAYTLQTPAYVRSLAQVEILFALGIGKLFFQEKLEFSELLGIVIITTSAILLVFLI